MAGIPQQVLDAAAAAEAKLSGEPAPAVEPTPAPTLPQAGEQIVPPTPVPPQEAPQPPSAPIQQPANTAPVAAPGQAAQPQAAPQPQAAAQPNALELENARLQQNLSVLQGKYNAELPRALEEAKQLREHNLQLLQTVQTPPAPQVPAPAPVTADNADLTKVYSDEQIDTYGEDFLRSTLRGAKQLVAPDVERLTTQLNELPEQYNEQLAGIQRQNFETILMSVVPEMATLNHDSGFNDWLDAPMTPYTEITNRSAFNQAVADGNLMGVKGFVDQYGTVIGQAPQPAPVPQPAPAQTLQPASLESQVVPDIGGNPVPFTPAQAAPTYTVAQYQALSNAVALGKYQGEARANMKAELDLAVAEGRVVN